MHAHMVLPIIAKLYIVERHSFFGILHLNLFLKNLIRKNLPMMHNKIFRYIKLYFLKILLLKAYY